MTNPFADWRELIAPALNSNPVPPEPTASPCQNLNCEDGWIMTEAGARRCPDCERRKKAAKLAQVYADAGLPPILQGSAFPEDADRLGLLPVALDEPYWREAHAYAQDVRNVIAKCVNIIFLGPVGTGKSQAGTLILRSAARAGFVPLAVSSPDWIGRVQGDYRATGGVSENQHIDNLSRPDLLLLDDLGAELPKDQAAAGRLLARVLVKRYDAFKPTIITTNLAQAADAPEILNLIGERSFSRVWNASRRLIFDGKDYRAELEAGRVADVLDKAKAAANPHL